MPEHAKKQTKKNIQLIIVFRLHQHGLNKDHLRSAFICSAFCCPPQNGDRVLSCHAIKELECPFKNKHFWPPKHGRHKPHYLMNRFSLSVFLSSLPTVWYRHLTQSLLIQAGTWIQNDLKSQSKVEKKRKKVSIYLFFIYKNSNSNKTEHRHWHDIHFFHVFIH